VLLGFGPQPGFVLVLLIVAELMVRIITSEVGTWQFALLPNPKDIRFDGPAKPQLVTGVVVNRNVGDTPDGLYASIVILEDDATRIAAMTNVLQQLRPSDQLAFFEDAQAMIAWLAEHLGEVDLISLDHDLPIRRDAENRLIDCGTGRQVADYLAAMAPTCPVIVHSSNEPCAAGMMAVLQGAGWPCRRVYPQGDLEWIADAWAEAVRECLSP
jgi:CheY-like chemotaxis protein